MVLDWFILELSHIVNYVVKACQRLQSPQKRTLWFVFKLLKIGIVACRKEAGDETHHLSGL